MEKKKVFLSKNEIERQTMVWIGIIFVSIFCYVPMFGIILAFKDDSSIDVMKIIFEAEWVGFDNFNLFLKDSEFRNVMLNTIGLNSLMLLINFPSPIIFAVLISELKIPAFKRTVQTISYLPHFLSWVVFGGMVLTLINTDTGVINDVLLNANIIDKPLEIAGNPNAFWGLIIITSLIKGVGWGSIIYLAAISGVSHDLYEAAEIDGANRFQRILNVTIPGIAPSIVTFLLLSTSGILNNSVEHILVFQNADNISKSQVIDTMVLAYGLEHGMYAYATAIGLFKSIIACLLLLGSNFLSKKLTGRGLY